MKIAKFIRSSVIIELTVAVFIILFVYTGISKFFDHNQFKSVLAKSPLIGTYANLISYSLPMLELIIASLLFFPQTKRIGLWSSLIMMVFFTGYLAYMIYYTPNLPCSCGGVLANMTWNQHLVFNITFTLLALLSIILNKKNKNKDLIRQNHNYSPA